MGTLTYDSKLTATFDDRTLAHLQIVIWSKLRRGEPFSFTWTEGSSNSAGRTSIWISSNIPLSFQFFGSKTPSLNRAWLDALTKSASSPAGLQLLPEPESPIS